MDEQILKDFIATAQQYDYNYDVVMPKFPELKDIELQVLKDYVATAEKHNYNYKEVNPKFPEIFSADKKKRKDFVSEDGTSDGLDDYVPLSFEDLESLAPSTMQVQQDATTTESARRGEAEVQTLKDKSELAKEQAFKQEQEKKQVEAKAYKDFLAKKDLEFSWDAGAQPTTVTATPESKTVASDPTVKVETGQELEERHKADLLKQRESLSVGLQEDLAEMEADEENQLNIFEKKLKQIDLTNETEETIVPALNYLFQDYGFTFEETSISPNAIKITAPGVDRDGNKIEKVIDFAEWSQYADPSGFWSKRHQEMGGREDHEKEIADFIRENRDISIRVDENKQKVINEEQLKQVTKDFNIEAKGYLQEYKRLNQEQEAINQLLEESAGKYAEGSPEHKNILNRIRQYKKEVGSLEVLEENLKTKGKEYDIMVGEYAMMRAEGGGAWRQFKDMAKSGVGNLLGFGAEMILTLDGYTNPFLAALPSEEREKFIKEMKYGKEEKFVNPFSKTATNLSRDTDEGWVEYVENLPFKAVGRASTKEYLQDVQQADLFSAKGLLNVAFGVTEFLTAAPAGLPGIIALSSQYTNKEMRDNPAFDDVPEWERGGVSLTIGTTVGWLERFGFKNILQSNPGLVAAITTRVLRKNPATMKTFNEYIEQDVKSLINKGVLRIAAGGAAEFETGALQETADIGLKEVYNHMKEAELFETPEDLWEAGVQVLHGATAESLGGKMMAAPKAFSYALGTNEISEIDNNTFQMLEEMSKDAKYLDIVTSKLEQQVVNQEITKAEMDKILTDYNRMNGAMQKMPEGINTKNKKQLLSLFMEYQTLKDKMEKTDDVFNKKNKEELAKIEKRIDGVLEANEVEKGAKEVLETKPGESQVFYAESLEDVPEEFRDRANRVEDDANEITFREKLFGLPIGPRIGKKKGVKIGEYYTYTLDGAEIQEVANKEAKEADPVQADTEVAEKQDKAPEVAPIAEVFYESEESIPTEIKEAKSTKKTPQEDGRIKVEYNEDEVFIEAPAVTEEFESMDAIPQAIKDASSTVITETDDGKFSVTYKGAEVLGVTLEGKKKEAPVQEEVAEEFYIESPIDDMGEIDYDAEDEVRKIAKKRDLGITSDREISVIARDKSGKIIGGAYTSYDNSTGEYTFDVVVDESVEGKGVGSMLLDEVKDLPLEIEDMNPDATIKVDVVNPQMQKMLENRGFEVVEKMGKDRVIMEPSKAPLEEKSKKKDPRFRMKDKKPLPPKIQKLRDEGMLEGIYDLIKAGNMELAEQVLEGAGLTVKEFIQTEGILEDMLKDSKGKTDSEVLIMLTEAYQGGPLKTVIETLQKEGLGAIATLKKEAQKAVMKAHLKSFERVDPETGEPLSIRLSNGINLVRLKGGEYVMHVVDFGLTEKVPLDSFEQLFSADQMLPQLWGKWADGVVPTELSKEEEAKLRSREEVKALEKKSKKKPPRKRLRLADEKKADTKKEEADIVKEMKAMDQAEKDFVVPRGKSERQDVNPVKESRSEVKLTDKEAKEMGFDSVDDMSRPIEYYEGIPMGILMSDHLASGTHKDAAGKPMKVKGGILFNTLGSIKNRALAWAGIDRDGAAKQYKEALSIYKANKPLFERLWAEGKIPYGHIPFAVAKMADSAINSNEAVFRWLSPRVKELEVKYPKRAKSAFKAFVDSISKLQGLTPKQRETLQETKAKLEQDPGNQKLQEKLDNLEEKQSKQIILNFIKKNKITTMSQLFDAVVEDAAKRAKNPADADLSLPPRAFLFKHVFSTPSKAQDISKVGPSKNWSRELLRDSKDKNKENQVFIPNSKEGVYNQLTEPSMREGRQGDIVAVMGVKVVDKDGKQAGGVKETDHENYGFGPEGKLISFVSNPRHGTDVFAEWEVKASRVFKVDKAGKKPSREGLRTQIGGTFFIDGAFRGMKVSTKERGIAAMLIAKMRHAFPTVGITASKAEFDAMMAREDVRTREKDGMIIYGITLDGNIYLNPEAIDIATPIHEFGHVWIDYLRSKALQAPKGKEGRLLAKGMALAKADKSYQSFVDKYGDKNLAAEELLVELIATKGETIVNASLKAKFKEWFNAFFKYIKESFTKSKDIKSGKIKDLTLDEFANIGLADLFGGQLIDGKFDPSEAVDSFKARLSIKESDGTKPTIDEIVTFGRQEGWQDVFIKEYLKSKNYPVAEINQALAISIDMNTPMPNAFLDVNGGAAEGTKMFNDIKNALNNWIKSRWGKGKTFTEYRAKAMNLLAENDVFKAQSREQQDKLIIAMDVVIGRKPARDASVPIRSMKDTVKLIKRNDWKGNIKKTQKSLRNALKPLGGTKIHEANKVKIYKLVNKLNEKNVKESIRQIEKILGEIIKDDKAMSNNLNSDVAKIRKNLNLQNKGKAARSKKIKEVKGWVESLSKYKKYKHKGIIQNIMNSLSGVTENNADVKFMDLMNALNDLADARIKEENKTQRLHDNIETLKNKIKEHKNQAKDLAKIKEKLYRNIKLATMYLRDVGVKEYSYSTVQRLVSSVEKTTIRNIAKKVDSVVNELLRVKEKARKDKLKNIDTLLKKGAKTKKSISGRTRSGSAIHADGQQFFQAALDFRNYLSDLMKASLANINVLQDAIQERERLQSTYPKKEDYQEALEELKNSKDGNDQTIARMIEKMDKILKNEETNPFISAIPELLFGIDYMTLEQLNDLEIDLKGGKLIFAMALVNKKAAEKALTQEQQKKAHDQLAKDFPFAFNEEVIDVNGKKEKIKVLKGKNERNLIARKKFKNKSIKEMIDGIKEKWKTGTGVINWNGHLGTICNYLDNIPAGRDFFTENIYKRLNRARARKLAGKLKQNEVLDQIAQSVGAKNYKKLKKKIFTTANLDIAVNAKGVKLDDQQKQALKILKEQKRKLLNTRSRKTGWIPLKNRGKIKAIDRQIKALLQLDPAPFTADEQMRLYALSLNEEQNIKLQKLGIDEFVIEEIKNNLGPELIGFVDKTVEHLSENYFKGINDVYRDVNNIDLKHIPNYFPTKTVSESADLQSIALSSSENVGKAFNAQFQSLIKERTDQKRDISLGPDGGRFTFTEELENHLDAAETYKAYAKDVKEMNAFMRSPDISAILSASGIGELTYKFINNEVNPISKPQGAGDRLLRRIYSNYVGLMINFKPMQFFAQSSSFIMSFPEYSHKATEKIPKALAPIKLGVDLALFAIDQVTTLFNPFNWRDAYNVSPEFRNRVNSFLSTNGYAKLESTITEKEANSLLSKIWKWFQFGGATFTMAGDLFGVMGYYGVYKRDLKNGMDPRKALEKFEDYNKTQQTKRGTEINKWQLKAKDDAAYGMITTFNSTQFLLTNIVIQSSSNILKMIEEARGLKKIPAAYQAAFSKDMLRLVFSLGLGHAAYTYVKSFFKYYWGDDEEKQEVLDASYSAFLGTNNLSSIWLWGQAVDGLEAYYKGESYRPQDGLNPVSMFMQAGIKAFNRKQEGIDVNPLKIEEFEKPLALTLAEWAAAINTDFFTGVASYMNGTDLNFRFYKTMGVAKSFQHDLNKLYEVKSPVEDINPLELEQKSLYDILFKWHKK